MILKENRLSLVFRILFTGLIVCLTGFFAIRQIVNSDWSQSFLFIINFLVIGVNLFICIYFLLKMIWFIKKFIKSGAIVVNKDGIIDTLSEYNVFISWNNILEIKKGHYTIYFNSSVSRVYYIGIKLKDSSRYTDYINNSSVAKAGGYTDTLDESYAKIDTILITTSLDEIIKVMQSYFQRYSNT